MAKIIEKSKKLFEFLYTNYENLELLAFFLYVPAVMLLLAGNPFSMITWDMTSRCFCSRYTNEFIEREPISPMLVAQLVFTFFEVAVFAFVKIFHRTNESLLRCLRHVYIFLMGIFTLIIIWYSISRTVGVPYPYYFQNDVLYEYFCRNYSGIALTSEIKEIDEEYRLSFPSLQMMISGYTYLYSVLYWDRVKPKTTFHITEMLIFIFMTYATFANGFNLYLTNMHHLEDIQIGFYLGIIVATISIKNSFDSRDNGIYIELPDTAIAIKIKEENIYLEERNGYEDSDYRYFDNVNYEEEVESDNSSVTYNELGFALNRFLNEMDNEYVDEGFDNL